MGIFDDVVTNAKSAAEAVGKKAGQLVDASKLRISLAELGGEIGKRYEALGQYVYDACRDSLANDAEATGMMAELDELKAQHAAVTKELSEKQNKVICPSCGKQSPVGAQYCSFCGTKLVQEAPACECAETEEKCECGCSAQEDASAEEHKDAE